LKGATFSLAKIGKADRFTTSNKKSLNM